MIRRVNRKNYRESEDDKSTLAEFFKNYTDRKNYQETINAGRKMDYLTIQKAREYMGDEYALDFILEELSDGALSKVAIKIKRWLDDMDEAHKPFDEQKKSDVSGQKFNESNEDVEDIAYDLGYDSYEPSENPEDCNPYSPSSKLSKLFMDGWEEAREDYKFFIRNKRK